MKALVFDRIGHPLDVLRLEDVPVPAVKDGEVLVRMAAASIKPGDFLFTHNLYPDPKKPKFPRQVAGNHGAGYIYLGTSVDDVAARALYERLGFTNREGDPDGPVMLVYEREL